MSRWLSANTLWPPLAVSCRALFSHIHGGPGSGVRVAGLRVCAAPYFPAQIVAVRLAPPHLPLLAGTEGVSHHRAPGGVQAHIRTGLNARRPRRRLLLRPLRDRVIPGPCRCRVRQSLKIPNAPRSACFSHHPLRPVFCFVRAYIFPFSLSNPFSDISFGRPAFLSSESLSYTS